MKILALDTAGALCSVALWQEGEVVSARVGKESNRHAEKLIGLVTWLMDEQVTPDGYLRFLRSVDLYAVSVGPGSFTGLRVGAATARALALAGGRQPVVGVSVFQLLALRALELAGSSAICRDIPVAVVLETPRSGLLVQVFDSELTARIPPSGGDDEQVVALLPQPPLVLAGDGANRLSPAYRACAVALSGSEITASSVARLAALGKGLDARPLYYGCGFRRVTSQSLAANGRSGGSC